MQYWNFNFNFWLEFLFSGIFTVETTNTWKRNNSLFSFYVQGKIIK